MRHETNRGLLLLYMLIALLLSGCWNRRELNELGIAVAAGIDRVEDRYRLSVQVVVPGQVASKKRAAPRHRPPYIRPKATRFLKRPGG